MKVIIVGGGIAGLAAAIAVARMRHQVVVFERAARIEERGAGLQIAPNGIKALEWLGAWELLRANTWQPRYLRFMDGESGRLIRSIAIADSFDRRFGSPYVVTHRADLLAALLATARSLPEVEIRTDSTITGLEWQGDQPTVRLAGSVESADAIVGADGLHSTIRQCLLADGAPPASGHVLFRALLPRIEAPAISADVVLWLLSRGHVVHYPVSGGKLINFVAVSETEQDSKANSTAGSPTEVAAMFPGVTAELRYLLGLPGAWHRWQAADRRPVCSWGTGPATLIGDAAHPIAPYLAQGAAAALEDSVTLGQDLDGVTRPADAFRRFESRRMARTTRLSRLSRRQGRVYHASGLHASLRNMVLAYVPTSLLLARLNWIYSWRP